MAWPWRGNHLWVDGRLGGNAVAMPGQLRFWVALGGSDHGKAMVEALGITREDRQRILPLCRAHSYLLGPDRHVIQEMSGRAGRGGGPGVRAGPRAARGRSPGKAATFGVAHSGWGKGLAATRPGSPAWGEGERAGM